MYTYKDEEYLVVEDLLLFASPDTAGLVPETVDNGHVIRRIGASAYRGITCKSITIPSTIRQIGEAAFQDCTKVQEVVLPRPWIHIEKNAFDIPELKKLTLHLSRQEYRELSDVSRSCGGRRHLLGKEDLSAKLEQLLREGFHVNLASIPNDISLLFDIPDKDEERINLYEQKRCYDFWQGNTSMSENAAFQTYIKEKRSYVSRLQAEVNNDWILRTDSPVKKRSTALLMFREQEIVEADDKVQVTFYILRGRFFWQSGQKVMYIGKEYYIYQRNYLVAYPFFYDQPIFPLREDIAVYLDGQLVKNYTISEDVYAKYKLSSIL